MFMGVRRGVQEGCFDSEYAQQIDQLRAYSFSSLFILDVATQSQKDHKLFSATYILCGKKLCN